jgi:hypothetical protein
MGKTNERFDKMMLKKGLITAVRELSYMGASVLLFSLFSPIFLKH